VDTVEPTRFVVTVLCTYQGLAKNITAPPLALDEKFTKSMRQVESSIKYVKNLVALDKTPSTRTSQFHRLRIQGSSTTYLGG